MLKQVVNAIIDNALVIVVLILLLTPVVGFGVTQLNTQGGTGDFTQATEEIDALTALSDAFAEESEGPPTGQTTLLVRDENAIDKESQVALLDALIKLDSKDGQNVTRTQSLPQLTARQLDPTAGTLTEQRDVLAAASEAEVEQATQAVLQQPRAQNLVTKDYSSTEPSAPSTRAFVTHQLSEEPEMGGPASSGSELQQIQKQAAELVTDESITVTGEGIRRSESNSVINDSLFLVLPAALFLIALFLAVSYRSLVDIVLGVGSLLLAVLWTFGLIGWAGVPFTQLIIVVPVLLLAVGVDFGIHVINRYREEDSGPKQAMETALEQLIVAFGLVTVTTIIGFGSNVVSPLSPIADYGVAASIGVIATFLVFGVFLPAAKVVAEESRFTTPQSTSAIGSIPVFEQVLNRGVSIVMKAAPIIAILSLIIVAGAGFYGTGVSTEFTQDNFRPPSEVPAYAEALPEPFKPSEYTATEANDYIRDHYPGENRTTVFIAIRGDLTDNQTLETLARGGSYDSDVYTKERGPLTVINQTAANDPTYRAIVDRADTDGDGIPDKNLESVYNPLLEQENAPLGQFISDDRETARVIYTADRNESQTVLTNEANEIEAEYESENLNATATGLPLVLKSVSDLILNTIVESLVIGFTLITVFLLIAYGALDRRPVLGALTLLPILVSITLIASTMRFFGIPFNAVTAITLSTALGLGIDYAIHISHRFTEEYDDENLEEAIRRSVVGTGGALTGSMLTTFAGLGTLSLALLPVLFQFGVLIGLTVLYTYVAAVVVLPAAIVVWATLRRRFL